LKRSQVLVFSNNAAILFFECSILDDVFNADEQIAFKPEWFVDKRNTVCRSR
jgi:hypothetical protein